MFVRSLFSALCCAVVVLAPAAGRAQEFSETPLPIDSVRAFPELQFRRPIVVTHAGDGTNRVFVAEQLGVIRVFANNPDVEETQVFLDIESRVVYTDKENEEGLLGVAFHPRFKQNGQFFVFYTTTDAPHTSVVSRFKVLANGQADPKSEVELLRIPRPFWNHDGGTLAFGPDGYLYICLGDGGSANDPQANGQNLNTLLGKILRIDVDHHAAGKNYVIPKDNPYAAQTGKAQPEIWASGLRNVWRMAFDRETGLLWAADVGQDLWEEIDIIVRGGNYGWKLREGRHKFQEGSDPRPDLIEPIWEYPHTIGKSITGGLVYRGKKLPALVGKYLYADYVTGKIWALDYDAAAKKVKANYVLGGKNLPVMTFGDDETGEVYYTTPFGHLYRFAPTAQ